MDTLNLVTLLEECKMSAEELGARIGISGMTVRRWTEKPNSEPLPEIYQAAIREAVFKLVIEGHLDSNSTLAQSVFSAPGSLSHQAALTALGFPLDLQDDFTNQDDKIMIGLSHIGSLESRRQRVEEDKKKLPVYKKISKEWSKRITILADIIASKNLTTVDKFPAYGALFYLFWTFDLIPDTIPVFGLMDDYAILGIAAAYYIRRAVKEKSKA